MTEDERDTENEVGDRDTGDDTALPEELERDDEERG